MSGDVSQIITQVGMDLARARALIRAQADELVHAYDRIRELEEELRTVHQPRPASD